MTETSVKFRSSQKNRRTNKDSAAHKEWPPFPIPLRVNEDDEHIIWPLSKTAGHLSFIGNLNTIDCCVDIENSPAANVLPNCGFFGTVNRRDPLAFCIRKEITFEPIVDVVPHENITRGKESSSKILNTEDIYLKSFLKAFHELPSKENTIKELYESDKISIGPSDLCTESKPEEPILEYLKMSTPTDFEHEILKLEFEEAFFLCYALDILTISLDNSNKVMDVADTWEKFSEVFQEPMGFPVFYAAYHYFRSMGWVVKNGIQYGSHFILYKEGPPFYHALFSVNVFKVYEEALNTTQLPPWKELCAFQRVSQGVSKIPVLCYVIIPSDICEEDYQTPKVIKKFKIQTLSLERWSPNAERENLID